MPIKYSKINMDSIVVEPLIKGAQRYSDIFYNEAPLVIQTPYSLKVAGNSMLFSLVKKGNFFNIYDTIFNTVCQKISGLDAYKGKFTAEKVKQKISTSPIEVNEDGDGVIYLQNIPDSGIKVYDYLMEGSNEVAFETLEAETQGSALLHIKRVLYAKTSISFEVVLVGIRLDPPKTEHIHQDILESSEEPVIVNPEVSSPCELSDEDDLVLDETPQLASEHVSDEDDFFFD
jgi:hypothetical protein